MAKMFHNLLLKLPNNLFVYMDDVLIATNDDLDLHQLIVDLVLDLFAQESYFLHPCKCTFEQTQIKYLGLVVDGDNLTIDPKKADGLCNWPRTLNSVKEVWSILGILGYQHPFIQNYANIAQPLVNLTRKDHPFIWTPECWNILDTLINIILNNLSLWQPNLAKPFFLQVDTSAFATGAILTQKDNRGKHVAVGFHSLTFNNAEHNYDYDIHNQELLAVYRGLTHNHHHLLSSPHPITVYTDHKNLEYYRKPQTINCHVT